MRGNMLAKHTAFTKEKFFDDCNNPGDIRNFSCHLDLNTKKVLVSNMTPLKDLVIHYTSLSALVGGGFLCWLLALLAYRVWFHPLAKVPGPFICKISGLYDFFVCLGEKRHENFERLFRKYQSHVIRFGPNEVVFNTAQAFMGIYAPTLRFHTKT
jgi:hypothetical protein